MPRTANSNAGRKKKTAAPEIMEIPDSPKNSDKKKADKPEVRELVVDYESDSDARLANLFTKKKATFAKLTKEQEEDIEKEHNRYLESIGEPRNHQKVRKSKEMEQGPSSLQKGKKRYCSDEMLNEIMAELEEVDSILYRNVDDNSAKPTEELVPTDDEDAAPRRTRLPGLAKLTTSAAARKPSSSEVVDISDDDDGLESGLVNAAEDSEDSEDDFVGELLAVQVCLRGKNESLLIYDNKTVGDLRKEVARRYEHPFENIQMFFGLQSLEKDKVTLKEAGLALTPAVDAFLVERTDEELFRMGCGGLMRFKLQTEDRRCRQNCFLYLRRDEKLSVLRDKIAEKLGEDPSTVRLRFDGDMLDLNECPGDCDLEGDECLDVVIPR